MHNFFTVGKALTLGFWLLPILAFMEVFPDSWNGIILIVAAVIFVAHLGELALYYSKLKAKGHGSSADVVMVILVGLFHWMPLLKEDTAKGKSASVPGAE